MRVSECPSWILAGGLVLLTIFVGCQQPQGSGVEGETSGDDKGISHKRADLELSAADAKAIAKEAYIYGFPMVMGYKTLYNYAVDKENPEYKGPFNKLSCVARLFTPEDKAIVTANADTPYCMFWMDLRAEPLVLSIPEMEPERFLLFPAHRSLHPQLRLCGHPHNRQRNGQVSHRRPRLERGKAGGHCRCNPERNELYFQRYANPALRAG